MFTVNGLDEGDLDLRKASILENETKERLTRRFVYSRIFTYVEDLVDFISGSDGGDVSKRARLDSDGNDKLANPCRLTRIRISEWIDRVPLDLE